MSEYTNTITSVAIGSFDGLHVAHRELIDQAEGVVVIERGRGYLTPGFKRSWYTDKPLFFYRFEKIQGWSAAEFVAHLREDLPRLRRIVVGYDFGFGQGREGDAAHLRGLFDGEVVIVDEVRVDGVSVHSRVIRDYLASGDLVMANRLLGREYLLDGEVIAGQGLGGRELVPTLNLSIRQYQLPAEGVYATRTQIAGEWYPSVSFLGHRVSTDGTFAVESHVLDREIGAVRGDVRIVFIKRLRGNQKFGSLAALREAIEKDIQHAKEVIRDR